MDDGASPPGDWRAACEPFGHRRRPRGTPHRSALLVLDMQRFFVESAFPASFSSARRILPAVNRLCRLFQSEGSPVLFTRHALLPGEDPGRMASWWGRPMLEGTEETTLCADLEIPSAARCIRKTRYSAFRGTELVSQLRRLGVDTVVVAGVTTHLCCETTARDAFQEGFHVLVVGDATASPHPALHVGSLRNLAHGFATVWDTAQVLSWRRAGERGPLDAEHPETGTHPALSAAVPDTVDVGVVGAGPAGLAAALQCSRQGQSVALFEAHEPGGLLRNANRVENAPGHPPRSGLDLARALLDRTRAQGVAPLRCRVEAVVTGRSGAPSFLELRTAAGPCRCRAVVLATGTRPRRAGIEGEPPRPAPESEAPAGSRVHYTARHLLAHAPEPPPGGRVAVIGGGDAAFDQALLLRRHGWSVEVLVRGSGPRALPRLVDEAGHAGVEIRFHAPIRRLRHEDSRLGLELAAETLYVDRVLMAVGREPAPPAVWSGETPLASVIASGSTTYLAHLGVYAAGDLVRDRLRQVALATGDGIEVAMRIHERLRHGSLGNHVGKRRDP